MGKDNMVSTVTFIAALSLIADSILFRNIGNIIINVVFLISMIIYVDSIQRNKFERSNIFSSLFIALLLLKIVYFVIFVCFAEKYEITYSIIAYEIVSLLIILYYCIYAKKVEKKEKENFSNVRNVRNLEANK